MASRKINLADHIPDFMLEYNEFKAIMNAKNPEFQIIEDTHNELVDNRYITTCNMTGIKRFENMLRITPLADDTLDERKFRVLSLWNFSIPYNYKYLEDKLNVLCGNQGYSIELNASLQTLIVKVDLANKKDVDSIKNLLEEVVPCNLVKNVILLYNTYEILEVYSYEDLEVYTYEELREGVLANV